MTKKNTRQRSGKTTADDTQSKLTERCAHLEAELERMQLSLAESENRLKRAFADYDNLKKRMIRDESSIAVQAQKSLLLKLLSLLDTFEHLHSVYADDQGVALLLQQFHDLLAEYSVQEIHCLGESFDPLQHEAIELVEGPTDTVVDVVRKGFLYNNELLRPAQVKVGAPPTGDSSKNK